MSQGIRHAQQRSTSKEFAMKRRDAIKISIGSTIAGPWIWRSLLGVGATMSLSGCDPTPQDVINYCTIGLNSARCVANILIANQIITTDDGVTVEATLDKIQSGFNDVHVAVQQYIDAPDSQKATQMGKALLCMQALADHI
jgi:hypothetical protein